MSDKLISYSAHAPVYIKIISSKKVYIQSMLMKTGIEVIFPIEKNAGVAKKWGNWIVECRESEIILFECRHDDVKDTIRMLFDDDHTDLQISVKDHKEQNWSFTEAEKLDISTNAIRVSTVGADNEIQENDTQKLYKYIVKPDNKLDAGLDAMPVLEQKQKLPGTENDIAQLKRSLEYYQQENKKLRQLLKLYLEHELDADMIEQFLKDYDKHKSI